MRNLVPTWRLFSRRSGRNWRLLAVLALGILVTATLLASAPVYARTMADLGLTFTVRDRLSETPGNRTEFRDVALQTEEARQLRSSVGTRVEERLGWFAADTSLFLRGPRFTLSPDGETTAPLAPLGHLQSFSGFEQHVSVVEGRLPETALPGEPIEVALSPAAADAIRLRVGQTLFLMENFDDCAREIPSEDRPPPPPCTPKATIRFAVPVTLVGTIEPVAATDSFWVGQADRIFSAYRLLPENGPVAPLFTTEATMLSVLGEEFPSYTALTAWNTFADPERLSRTNFERARADLRGLFGDLTPLGGSSFSPLAQVLEDYRREAQYQQAPLTILLLEVAAVAIFYVVIVAMVIVERQADEISLLRSRGATTSQVGFIYLAEGILLGVPCVLIAPFLAGTATSMLGLTPTFETVNDGKLLPVTITASAFLYAAGGAALSILALLVPALLASRSSAVVRRREQARPGVSFIQRYYLDLALAGVAVVLLWELRERGNVFTPSPAGGVSSDPLLLASPAILVAAAAALMLRFYPLALRLGARLMGRNASASMAVGLWQVARSPGNSARLALLLTMAVAVGTFAASYASTAAKAFDERALFRSGVEFRAQTIGTGPSTSYSMGTNTERADRLLSELEGVRLGSAALRTNGGPATAGTSFRGFQVLAVDPDVANALLWFRDDFADSTLRELLAPLGAPEPLRGIALPAGTGGISMKILPSPNANSQTLWVRVRDGNGFHQMLQMGSLEGTGWQEYSVELRRGPGGALNEPMTLMSIIITEPANRFNSQDLVIHFDEITALTESGPVALEGFESAEAGWVPLAARPTQSDVFTVSTEATSAGRQSGKLTRAPGQSTPFWGILVAQSNVPLPVVASRAYVDATGVTVGSTRLMAISSAFVPIRVVGIYERMPTLNSAAGASVIFNREHLISYLGLAQSDTVPGLNEAWFELEPGADRAALDARLDSAPFYLTRVTDRESELATLKQNPLISAGGAGILYLAFGAVLILVGAALLVSLWVSVQRRRTEFAVMRALGLSRGQVVRLLGFEYAIVAVLGLVVGAYLGRMVGERMLSFLNVDQDGRVAEPSFILQTNWLLVAAGAAVVLLVFFVALGFAGRLISRTSDGQALRTE